MLSSHGLHDSPLVVEDNKAKDPVLGSIQESSPVHSQSPSIKPVSIAMSQGDSRYQSPVDTVNMSTKAGSSATVVEPDRKVHSLSYQSHVLSKKVNSGVSHSVSQFHKTSTPKSPKVYLALTESLVQDCHQSPTRQLHFDSPWLEPPLLVDGHSLTNALGKIVQRHKLLLFLHNRLMLIWILT